MTVRLALFDCDGTLVDGQAGVCNAMDQAFADAGLPSPDRHLVRRIVGLSLPQAIRSLAPEASDAQHAEIELAYRSRFRASRESGALAEPLYDGMAELVADLAEAGWVLGVATGKSARGLEHCLATHGLTRHFTTLQTADQHPSKPHPAMVHAALAEGGAEAEHCVMIGDTAFDMAMAQAAGVRALGVDWGYHAPAELVEAGAEAVAMSPAHLRELIG